MNAYFKELFNANIGIIINSNFLNLSIIILIFFSKALPA